MPFAKQFALGVTHYPEHTDRANWEPDQELMSAHGFNYAREPRTVGGVTTPPRDFVLV